MEDLAPRRSARGSRTPEAIYDGQEDLPQFLARHRRVALQFPPDVDAVLAAPVREIEERTPL